ncbi:MAG: hypothetical protein NZ823_07195 [Blastocatellia bacterium]|nr:hypothetical protein [Blastocatellia bacterium]
MGPKKGNRVVSKVLENWFPGLCGTPYEVTSPADVGYNCIAWATQDTSRWWEPDPLHLRYWPREVRREYTLQAYADAFRLQGFEDCADAGLEEGWEKVALFATPDGTPTHAARQLPDGTWTSKLGTLEDIKHLELTHVAGQHYGQPVIILRRRRKAASSGSDST